MDFELTDDQQMLKSVFERFVTDRYGPSRRAQYRATQKGYSPENWSILANLGFFALPFDQADDGLNGDVVDIITVMEAVGKGLVVEPLLDEICIAGMLLAAAGSAAQKKRWIGQIMAGEAHLALAHAEHGSRYNLHRCDTRLEPSGLHGSKTFVPGGADAYLVTAVFGNRIRLCLVASDAIGVVRRDYRLVDGSVASELHFEGAPAELMPGGIEEVETIAEVARAAVCAEMIGIMSLLFDATLAYVRERHQFGVPIASFQTIQHRLADLYVLLEQSRSLLYRSVLAQGGDPRRAVAAAKYYISTAALRLGEECMQLHGAMGISDELLIGHGHKRILLLSRKFGDADYELIRYDRMAYEVRAAVASPGNLGCETQGALALSS